MTDKEDFHFSDFMPQAQAARPATLAELEDLLLDCYEAAPGGEAGWKVFSIVESFVFDHIAFEEAT